MEPGDGSLGRFRQVSHILLIVALVGGIIAVCCAAQLGLIPAAVVFGWAQTGTL